MGLFDNIFLDKDTPTRINGGAAIIDIEPPAPQSTGGSSGGTGDDAKTTKIQAQSSFTPDISGAVDLSLSTSVPGTLDEHGVTFDIGGDLDFSMPPLDTTIDPSMVIPSDTAQTISEGSSIAMIQGSTAMGGEFIVDGAMIPATSTITIHEEEDIHTAVALPDTIVEPVAIMPETPTVITEAVITSPMLDPLASIIETDTNPSAGLFGILDANTASETGVAAIAVSDTTSTPIIGAISPIIGADSIIEASALDTKSSISTVSRDTSYDHHSFDTILTEYIAELERLNERDKAFQEKLATRLEILDTRKKDLEEEYETRRKALKYEEDECNRERTQKANEKSRIERVINSLRTEIQPS